MDKRQLLQGLLVGLALGVLVFLVVMTRSVDNNLHITRLNNLRAIDTLDVGLNRVITQTRVSSLANVANERAVITRQLGEKLTLLEKGDVSFRGLSPDLDKVLDTFINTIDDKFGLAFDFEARDTVVNQRLITSLDSVPVLADDTMKAANPAAREQLVPLLAQLKAEITNFGVMPTPTNGPAIRALLDEIDSVAAGQSAAFKEATGYLRGGAENVMADKAELVEKLTSFLGRPTGPQLREVQEAYMAWHSKKVSVANIYGGILAAYSVFLLFAVFFFVARLRVRNQQLDRAYGKLSEANETLEHQVQDRTKDLTRTLQELRDSEAQLIQSEKMAGLGQMVAGIAHEINTPLGYARSNAEIVRTSLIDITELCASQSKALTMLTSESATDEEIAVALADAAARDETVKLAELAGELNILLGDADYGLVQIADLVGSLKNFSRVDRSRFDKFNIHDGLESTLKIAHNQLKHRVEVVKTYGELPTIECSPSQLNQVFLNLITNAAQAIEGEGKIYIHTTAESDGVTVRIMDTGGGMPEEVRKKIFEPFFTTKAVGQGTGLGLTIVFRIIEEHGGTIEVKSKVGKGTEFIIKLPLKQKRQKIETEHPAEEQAAEAAA